MKKVLTIFYLIFTSLMFSQNHVWQGDETDHDYQEMMNSSYYNSFDQSRHQTIPDEFIDFKSLPTITFKVFIHDVNNNILNECDYLHGINYLNSKFNQFNFFFKYDGYDYTNNTKPNVLNVFLINSSSGGHAIGPDNIRMGQVCFDQDSPFIHTSTIAHEFGHIFGINHTFTGTFSESRPLANDVIGCYGTTIHQAYFPRFSNFSENVTRDVNDPNYNADIAGDQITDTPAMYDHMNICLGFDANGDPQATFLYIPEIVDAVGEPYVDLGNIGTENIMSYTPAAYRKSFTNGQGRRMREIVPTNPYLQPYISNIKELYKAYKHGVEHVNNRIVSVTEPDDAPGFVDIKRERNEYCLFQPGFTYKIYNISNDNYVTGDIVSPHDATFRETIAASDDCIVKVYGIRFGVQIPEISNDIILYDFRDTNLPWSRYSTTREQVIETDVHTTDNPANPNGIDRTFNTQESADPNLINNLENNKYHIIKKTSETGVQIQKTIYKNQ